MSQLRAIALDVNTVCQLRCEHCYLPSDRTHEVMSPWLMEAVIHSGAQELVVVGMEPFFNRMSTECVERLVNGHSKVSIITNGVNIHNGTDFLSSLHNVDISMDAGPKYWDASHHGRGSVGAPPFVVWADRIRTVRSQMRSLYTLNTLSVANCIPERIDDMVEGANAIDADHVMFSIFVKTSDSLSLSPVTLSHALVTLESSQRFRNQAKRAYLIVDRYHLDAEGLSFEQAREMIAKSSIQDQVELLEEYPHDMEIARINTGGLMQTTHDALWGPLSRRSQGVQLKEGDRITSDLLDTLNKRFPYPNGR